MPSLLSVLLVACMGSADAPLDVSEAAPLEAPRAAPVRVEGTLVADLEGELPEGSRLKLELVDLDADRTVLVVVEPVSGALPRPFAIEVPAAKVQAGHRYAVGALVRGPAEEELLRTAERVPALQGGAESLVVRLVPPAVSP